MIFYSGGSSLCLAGVALWLMVETGILCPIVLTICITLFLWILGVDIKTAFEIAMPISVGFSICVTLFFLYKCIEAHIENHRK